MTKINVYNIDGKQVDTMEVKSEVFGAEYNEPLIHQVIVAQLANKRQGTKCTLTRSEVRGGGIKPWRQKGTGRARQGSIRAPQWVKGGVVFAPKPRDFSKKINKKVKFAAFKSAISAKLADGNLVVLDSLTLKAAKTREMAAVLKNLSIDKRVLLVVDDSSRDALVAARNIPTVKIIDVDLLNVYDIAANVKCLMTVSAVKKIEEVYSLC